MAQSDTPEQGANAPRSAQLAALLERASAAGYTPADAELPLLIALIGRCEKKQAQGLIRALARKGAAAATAARDAFLTAKAPLRGRLCAVVGRVAQQLGDEALARWLAARLEDADAKTQRNAMIALGKLPFDWIEAALLTRWAEESEPARRRTLADALGKVGGSAALRQLEGAGADDGELQRIAAQGALKIERTLAREQPGAIDPSPAATWPAPLWFHCRSGLELLLCEELSEKLPAARPPAPVAAGRVVTTLEGPLRDVHRIRGALRIGFPLPLEERRGGEELAETVARALSSHEALRVLRSWTSGRIRYRLEWKGAGHRRGATWRCSQLVSERCPELLNDASQSLWQVIVYPRPQGIQLELWPRALADLRFAYRRREVPAASHPTVAATLARVAGVRADDVVWDPFCGSGLELAERGLLGPYRKLLGSDIEATALAAAQENLAAAGLERFELLPGDARALQPPTQVSCIITNPPLGRRVLHRSALGALYGSCLPHLASCLQPGGRLVWISPLFERTVAEARRCGLRLLQQHSLDVGGFHAELQAFCRESLATDRPRR